MYICYIDESGTPEIPGTTSHFVLAGLSIPIWHWRDADHEVANLKKRYGMEGEEFHTGWILRKYIEQSRIAGFEKLPWHLRRSQVEMERTARILALQKSGDSKTCKQEKKNFAHPRPYIHLTLEERQSLARAMADVVSNWGYARLFAECVDKTYFDPARSPRSVGEQALEQIVSRFEPYLVRTEEADSHKHFGVLVHDNNQTVAKKHTDLMRSFHKQGTLWTRITRVVETPLFVDSSLTGMVQVADLCSYAIRRYLENQESDLFTRIFARADRVGATVVGVRHYAAPSCQCEICKAHRR